MVLPTIIKNKKVIFLLFFLFCLFIQIIPVIRSGLSYDYGLGFWGANGHDAVWHLALINNIDNPLKINMPIFSGEILKNYHPFFDILISFLSKITHINSSYWLFQIYPVISASLFLCLSFLLGKKLTNKFSGALILMLLNSVSNSFGWLVTLIRFGNFNGESLFWAMQSPSNQLNPPFALSILLLLLLIYLLTKTKPNKIFIFFILFLLPVIKVYSVIPAYIIYFFYCLKHRSHFVTFFISLVGAGLLFILYNPSSSSLIKFQPFWFTNSMVESVDRFYLPALASFLHSANPLKYIFAEIVAILIFFIGNFAWRLIAAKDFFKNLPLSLSIIICSLIPLLFVQKGTSWNTIQFLYYALFLANIPFAVFLSRHLKTAVVIILLELLPLIGSLPNYLGKIPPTAISLEELKALNFLKVQPQGNVLTYPYDPYIKKYYSATPIPIYAYETTSYVSAYSQHSLYLADEMNLENSAYAWRSRRQDSLDFFSGKNQYQNRGLLVNNKIDYLYLPKVYLKDVAPFSDYLSLENIYENTEVIIYRVKR